MSNPERPIGHNRLAQIAPECAVWCQFQNAKQHKAHGKYALGITMLSNSSIFEEMKLKIFKPQVSRQISAHQWWKHWEEIWSDEHFASRWLIKAWKDTNQLQPSTPSPQAKQTNFTTPSFDSSTISPQPNKHNIITPSFDPHQSPLLPN